MRQVDPARRPGRPPEAKRRQREGRRPERGRTFAAAWHGIPAAHPVPLAAGPRQRRLRPEDAGPGPRRAQPARHGDARTGGVGGLRRALARPTVRGYAAARGDRPGAGQPAAPAADGRALRRPRRADPAEDADLAAGRMGAGPHHGAVRHPRHRRGPVPGGQGAGDEPPSGTDHRRPGAGLPAPSRHPAGDQRRLRAPETPLPGTARPRRRPPVAAPDPARLAAGHHPGPTADRHMTCKNATLPEILELSPRLEDADPGVRRLALIELADLELPEALPLLVAALRGDPDPGVRGEAARLLEAWEEDAVEDALCAALADPLPAVAEAAGQSLGEHKEPAAGRRLLPWLGHADAFVRASVLRALRELRLEESAVPALAAVGDPQAAVRREAVAVLGWLRHQPALAELARLASADVDPEVRRAATGALGLSREATVLPALCAALADAQWQVREEAATTLGKLGREEAGEPLLKALADDYWQVRLRAARALGRLRHRPAREALEALLGHPIGNLRKEAALALGELADPASAQALRVAEGDGDPEVRKAVRIALAQLRMPA
ncbi:hypothetical protein PAMH19_5762 [Pseudomonas aeruginosa]|nr:hypothetical protein PAMH19_5762 [Pseudomonas aeruginosa]